MGLPQHAPPPTRAAASQNLSDWNVSASCAKGLVLAAAGGVVDGLTPQDVLDILRLPEGAPLFRVERRTLLPPPSSSGATAAAGDEDQAEHEEVSFRAPIRVLFWKAWARTVVRQRIQMRRGGGVIDVAFSLLHSDMMSHLEGGWTLEALPGAAPATRLTYRFSMWPKGVPSALRVVPGLMDAVRGAAAREATQLCDKIAWVARKAAALDGDGGGGGASRVARALRAAGGDLQRAGGSFKLHVQRQQLLVEEEEEEGGVLDGALDSSDSAEDGAAEAARRRLSSESSSSSFGSSGRGGGGGGDDDGEGYKTSSSACSSDNNDSTRSAVEDAGGADAAAVGTPSSSDGGAGSSGRSSGGELLLLLRSFFQRGGGGGVGGACGAAERNRGVGGGGKKWRFKRMRKTVVLAA